MFVPVTLLFVHKVYIGGTMGSVPPRPVAGQGTGRGMLKVGRTSDRPTC